MEYRFTYTLEQREVDFRWDPERALLWIDGVVSNFDKGTYYGKIFLSFMKSKEYLNKDAEQREIAKKQIPIILKKLGLSHHGTKVIETVRGQGYRWLIPVTKVTGTPQPEEEPEQEAPVPTAPHVLDRYFVPCDDLIREKTADFVGRDYVFEAIAAFRHRHDRGYFMIEAEPGAGKTSLMAALVARHGYAHHFNRRGTIDTPTQFLQNICAQLITRYKLPYNHLEPGIDRDDVFLKKVLTDVSRQVTREDPCTILVDALDEAAAGRPGGNLLCLPDYLPAHVFIVLTMRRTEQPYLNRIEAPVQCFPIEDDEANRRDLRAYVRRHSDLPGIAAYCAEMNYAIDQFVAEMVEVSTGNFMYLYYVLPEVGTGAYRERRLSELPRGLTAYYLDHWQRMKELSEQEWHAVKLPVIYQLSVMYEARTAEHLSQYSGVQLTKVVEVLEAWAQFIRKASQQQKTHYLIYHSSYSDFLQQRDQVKAVATDQHGAWTTAAHRRALAVDMEWLKQYRAKTPS